MGDPDKARAIMSLLQELEEYVEDNGIVIAPTTDLVLDLGAKLKCDYYFADHHHRSVFWLDTYQAESFAIWGEVRGVTSSAQIGTSNSLS